METWVETTSCKQCWKLFSITLDDTRLYEMLSPTFAGVRVPIPSPIFCSDCRAQNILSTRNERNLYRRKCDATGRDIVSIHNPSNTFKVYDQNYWWGNNWNALDYGRDFDFSRPFFDQFIELFQSVPKISLNAPMSQNSEFTNQCQSNKDCYMLFCCWSSENCYYGMWYQECKFCMDCLYIENCEHCYEVVNAIRSYNCHFSKNLEACSDIYFSRDLINCKYCILCFNLQNREYCIENKQYTKDEYENEIKKLKLTEQWAITKLQKKFQEYATVFPVKYYQGKRNEKFSWDYIQNSKETYIAFNCRDNDVSKYCRDSWRVIQSYDLIETLIMEYCLEVEWSSYAHRCFFSAKLSHAHRVFYSSHCNGVQDLFWCVWLNHQSLCILNKKYEKEDYEEMVLKIIQHMQKTGEWWIFFPPKMSPFGYNETVAQEYYPMTPLPSVGTPPKAEGSNTLYQAYLTPLHLGEVGWGLFNWSDYEVPFTKVQKIIPANTLPETISQVPDDILNWAVECEVSKKPFRITSQELQFYRQHHLPIPKKHHDVRHLERMNSRNTRKLLERNCSICHVPILSTFPLEIKTQVLCEGCYEKIVQ